MEEQVQPAALRVPGGRLLPVSRRSFGSFSDGAPTTGAPSYFYPVRLALTLAHRCRGLLFHRDWLARQLTLFDRWLVVLGATDPRAPQDDGTALILRDVARRHPDRVRLEEAPAGWGSELAAARAVLATYREELDAPAHLFLVPPGEVWEFASLAGACQELDARALDAALVAFDCYVTDELLVRSGWEAAPRARLWRWSGQLPQAAEPLTFPGLAPPQLLSVKAERYPLYLAEQVRAYAARHGPPDLLHRWVHLQTVSPATFPRPLTDLLGTSGRIFTDSQLLHHDQPTPFR